MSESRLLAGRVVTRASTSQQVADVIKEQLLLGQVSPGTRLSDRIIAVELQVSRNTVREAMTILAAEGLVVQNLHKGVVVADLDLEELRDLYQARRALELAGLRAASTADPQWRTALDEALAAMRQAVAADDLKALLDADRSFHEALVHPIGSKRVQAFYRKVQTEIRLTRAWYGAREDSEVFLRRHQRIGDAIRVADYVLAEKLLTDLINAGEERLRRQLQAPPSTADLNRSGLSIARSGPRHSRKGNFMIPGNRRRLASSMAVLASALLLATGCSSSSGSSSSAAGNSSGAAVFSKSHPLRIGLVLPDLTNQTIDDVYVGAKQEAAQLGDVQIIEGGTSDTQQWLNACDQIVTAHINVLAYDTLDAASTSSCILQANAMHIPTICLFACTLQGHNNTLITLNFYTDGVLIGKWMAQAIGPNGQYGLMGGPTGDMAIQAVQKGYLTTVKADCPGCKLVANVPAGGTTAASGYTTGLEVLTAHPGINGIYAADDDIAQGLVRAVQQDNKLGKVLVAGHNGTCQALASILKGQQDYTILLAGQPFGIDIVNAAFKLMANQTVSTINVQVTGVDHQIAVNTLSGQTPDPPGVNLKQRLQDAQGGCKILG